MKPEKRTSSNATKKLIIEALSNIDNPGKENLLKYLEESDFFKARCHSHHTFEGGLAHHSLGTAWKMVEAESDVEAESRFIVGLLHDLCSSHHSEYNHIGRGHHGMRSVALLDALGFKLTAPEREAICKHMHKVRTQEPSLIQSSTVLKLRNLIYECDHADAATQPRDAENPYERARRAFMNAFGNLGLMDL